ncbi:MAG: T9SS type A sorting domain-containing protein [Cyclobacteriaceae bacterium]
MGSVVIREHSITDPSEDLMLHFEGQIGGLTISPDGYVYILAMRPDQILKYDFDGKLIEKFEFTYNSSVSIFNILVDESDNIFFLAAGGRIIKYDSSFTLQWIVNKLPFLSSRASMVLSIDNDLILSTNDGLTQIDSNSGSILRSVSLDEERGGGDIVKSNTGDIWVRYPLGFYKFDPELNILKRFDRNYSIFPDSYAIIDDNIYDLQINSYPAQNQVRRWIQGYRFGALPEVDGIYAFQIPSNVFHTYQDVTNSQSNEISVEFDKTPPNMFVHLMSEDSNSYPISFSIEFDEEIVTPIKFNIYPEPKNREVVKSDGNNILTIWPWGRHLTNVEINTDVQDSAGNSVSESSRSFSFDYDPPLAKPELISILGNPVIEEKIYVQIRYSIPVNKMDWSKVKVRNGNREYKNILRSPILIDTIVINPSGDYGLVDIVFLDSAAQDIYRGFSMRSDSLSIKFDHQPLLSPLIDETIILKDTTKFEFEFELSRPFESFNESLITIENGKIVKTVVSYPKYVISIAVSTPESEVHLSLPKGVFIDEYEISSRNMDFYFIVDTTPPEVTISTIQETINSTDPFEVSVFFDDPVFNFDIDPFTCLIFPDYCFNTTDLKVSGGEIVSFWASSDYQRFSFDVEPVNQVISIYIPEKSAVNAFDMSNLASNELQIIYKDGLLSNEGSNIQKPIEVVLTERNLEVKLKVAESVTLQVYDLQGRGVINEELNTNARYDLSSVSAGVYVIRLISEEGEYFQKVILK